MATLIQRFQRLFRPRQEEVAPATVVTAPTRPSTLARLLAEESDRRTVVEECRLMQKNDPRARGVIRALAKDAVRGGFELVVEGVRADEAKGIAEEMLERVGLWKEIDRWVRMGLRDGDLFLECVAGSNGDLVEVSRKPTLEMHRLSDEFDRFVDPGAAYAWSDALWSGWVPGQGLPPGAVTFAEWQMIHARYDFDGDGRYGTPLFGAARGPWKRIKEGELDISVRRKTRAGMKYVHSLEDASESDIEGYRVRNQAALGEPFAAVADFFANKRTTIQAVQGDAHLSEIDDVMHHIRTWWTASPLPMSLLGYGQDLNRDVLEEQKEQYDLAKEELARWVSEEIVLPLVERQWLLKGIWPGGLETGVEWMSKAPLTPVRFGELAKGMAAMRAIGLLGDESLLRLFSRFVPDFDVETELAQRAGQMRDEAERVAQNMGSGDDAATDDPA